jgi:heptose-I-phosphate ethanolaminephosphotransferase
MTDDLPHLMLYLAGIHCKEYQEARCLISNRFNMKRMRLIAGEVDFDSVVNNNQ